jgi:amino acid transporter/nucleotide-binding universal stress UspA family protein
MVDDGESGKTAPGKARTGRLAALPDKLFDRSRSSGQLGFLLAWAVVFADIGTSLYYVPGILFDEFGKITPSPAAAFVLATGLVFILLSLKYVEVSARYPDGGGVVSVATDAFGPMVGCLGGILICVDYFLTTAISSVSGFEYLGAIAPVFEHHIVLATCAAIALLGVLNVVGIRESAMVTAALAVAALIGNLVVMTVVGVQLTRAEWHRVFAQFSSVGQLSTRHMLAGFGSAWLAFSGLESISQIAPALRVPRHRTALRAMLLVVATILITSPLITALETALLDVAAIRSERFFFGLAHAYGPRALEFTVVLTSATLLLGATNTAIIGCYHVFLALVRLGFMPRWLNERNRVFNTPHRAILVSVAVPAAVVILSRGQMAVLGDMYAFGLLGAFTLTSLGLDRVRWQERRRGFGFSVGALTSFLVMSAWAINLVNKMLATLFGGSVALIGIAVAIAVRKGWIAGLKEGHTTPDAAERAGGQLASAVEIVTMSEALDMRPIYTSSTLVAMRAPNLRLFQEAAARVRGVGENAVYLLFVDEIPGLFFPPKAGPSHEAREVLAVAVDFFRRADIVAIPIWRMAHDAGSSVAGAAQRLGVDAVLVGTSQRSALWHLLRGNVLRTLTAQLPARTHVWICN